ncbi:MAG: 8-amino-7-oxononanoate synthase [Verrucomicrobiota bacterium]
MATLDDVLSARLAELEAGHLRRGLRTLDSAQGPKVSVEGEPLLNFSSNDYLGLAWHPRLIDAAATALKRSGTGAGASRLICGNLDLHAALDQALADWKQTEAALSFSTGYATALGVIPSLVGRGDTVIADKLAHACLIDAARLSGATLRVFPHNNTAYLEKVLRRTRERRGGGRHHILILAESIYSMDGDTAPLEEILRLKDAFGAWLLVDEAHAAGITGPAGRGRLAERGLADRVDLQMGTLSKALGSAGGYVAGSRTLVDFLVNRARSFIYSTAPPPGVAAASLAALELVQDDEGERLREQLWANVRHFVDRMPEKWRPAHARNEQAPSAIVPVTVGAEERALALAEQLRAKDLLVPAIRYPTVPRGQARLRVTLSAAHQLEQIDQLADTLFGS